jgi:hypothetical protein
MRSMIRVAGIDVPRAAIAELAAKLHSAGEITLAEHIGIAIDENYDELTLPDPDLVWRVLISDPIPGLEELRRVLHDALPIDSV